MTTERWNDERLDRLAESVVELRSNIESLTTTARIQQQNIEALAATAQAHQQDIEVLAGGTQSLQQNIESLVSIAQNHQQSLQTSQQQFDILVQEIRGLRAENRRILAHLFGERNE